MREALAEAAAAGAAGNAAAGAVIVNNDRVVARGRNLIVSTLDPTAHAEIGALRAAGPALGRVDYAGHTLYSTGEPCPMCFAAIMTSGISRLVIGRQFDPRQYTEWGAWAVEKLRDLVGWTDRIEVVRGVLSADADVLRNEWLAKNTSRRRELGDRTVPTYRGTDTPSI